MVSFMSRLATNAPSVPTRHTSTRGPIIYSVMCAFITPRKIAMTLYYGRCWLSESKARIEAGGGGSSSFFSLTWELLHG